MMTKHLKLPEALLKRIDATADRLFAKTGKKPRRSHAVALLIQVGLDVTSAELCLAEFFMKLGTAAKPCPRHRAR